MAEGDATNTPPDNPWQFTPDSEAGSSVQPAPPTYTGQASELIPNATAIPPTGPDGSIIWTASEFIAHNKAASWYAGLLGFALLLAVAVWFITKDTVSAAVVIVGAIMLAVYGARQPRQLEYRLDQHELSIGSKSYPYQLFRSFSIVPEGAFNSIVFMPLKRFSVPTTIYYAPDDEEKIVALLADRLPMAEHKQDMIDRLMWRIRF